MGLFSKKHTVVDVVFRGLDQPMPEDGGRTSYRYVSTVLPVPHIGDRLWVRGGDGRLAPVIVIGVAQTKDIAGLSPVERAATAEDVAAAAEKARSDLERWFKMARKAAGLPVEGRVGTNPPGDHAEIPPASGRGSRQEADEWGRGWYRIWKLAQEHDLPADEVAAYRSVAYRWFAIRDRG